MSNTVYRSLQDEAELDGASLTHWVLEAAIFRLAYQHAERGHEMREALREAWTWVVREEQFGKAASDRLREAVMRHCPDLVGEVVQRLEEWDPAAAMVARSVYGLADDEYLPERNDR